MMEGVESAEHRIGLISMTADALPNIGPIGALPGLFLGCFNAGGFGYHAVAVLLLAELIVAGQTRIEVSEFSPDRFKDMDVDAHLATDLKYKAALRPYRRPKNQPQGEAMEKRLIKSRPVTSLEKPTKERP